MEKYLKNIYYGILKNKVYETRRNYEEIRIKIGY